MIKTIWLCGIAAAAFTMVCTASESGYAADTSTIKIGVPEPMSGGLAAQGIDAVNAAKLAAKQINEKGGVLGRKLEILAIDDACDAQQGVQGMLKLINEGIMAVAGGFCSGAAIPESDVARRHGGLPFIATISSNPKFTEQGYTNVFRIAPRDDQAAAGDAAYIQQILHAHTVAILHDNTTYSKALGSFVKGDLEKDGISVVYFDALTPGANDYTSVLTKVRTYNADVLYYSGYYPEFGLLIKQWKSLGLGHAIHGGGSTWDPILIKTGGRAAEDPGVSISTTPQGEFSPGINKISDAYRAEFGTDPGAYATWEHDGIVVLAKAIARAKSTDADAVNHALHEVDYQGLTGPIKFDAKGDRGALPFIALAVRDGKFIVTARYDGSQWIKN